MTRLWTIGTRPERGLDSYAKPCNLESKKPPVGVVAASNPHRPERSKMTLLNWSRLSEQQFRVDKWSLCRG
jgi:hypothetical protein